MAVDQSLYPSSLTFHMNSIVFALKKTVKTRFYEWDCTEIHSVLPTDVTFSTTYLAIGLDPNGTISFFSQNVNHVC